MPEWLGWGATVVFTASYFCKDAGSLRRVQMLGALLWIVYGVAAQARPVVAANLLVLTAAAVSIWRPRGGAASGAGAANDVNQET
jgi:hypothetical protein